MRQKFSYLAMTFGCSLDWQSSRYSKLASITAKNMLTPSPPVKLINMQSGSTLSVFSTVLTRETREYKRKGSFLGWFVGLVFVLPWLLGSARYKIFFSHYFYSFASIREIREGWLLLTVETEVNGDTKSSNERGPSLAGFGGFVVPVKETSILPWLFWSAQYKIFYTISIYVSPSPSNLGWHCQACRAVCL